MKVLVVKLEGDFAHFRIPETTRENLSYPFPPRTAVLGLLGAILGEPRNQYWDVKNPLSSLNIAVEILNPIKRNSLKVNYIRVKETITIQNSKILIPEDPFGAELIELNAKDFARRYRGAKYSRGMNAPTKLDLIEDASYQLYIHTENLEIYTKLKDRLENKKYYYPPYLGHANLLARVEYVGEFEGTKISTDIIYKVNTIVPYSAIDSEFMKEIPLSLLSTPTLLNIPMAMKKADDKTKLSLWNIIAKRLESVFLVRPEDEFKAKLESEKGVEIKKLNKTITFL